MSGLFGLMFEVLSAEAVSFAASPLITLKLRINAQKPVHTLALRCQVQIESQKRAYTASEQSGLSEIYGAPARHPETLRPLLWMHTSVLVPAFTEQGTVELPLPVSYDFSLAAAKYFHALEDGGEVPLLLLFSGTVFYTGENGALTVAPVPWSKEARFRMPVRILKEVRDHYYPNSESLLLRRDLFDRLRRLKNARGFTTWEQTLESLLGLLPGEAP